MFENVFILENLLEVKEFHGLYDDLKIISKRVNPCPLSCPEVLKNKKPTENQKT